MTTRFSLITLKACLEGGRFTLASGLTLAEGETIARVYKKKIHRKGNLTTRDHFMHGHTGLPGLTLPGVLTWEQN